MSKVKVSTFLTLDGVMQAPGDAGEFERGGWQLQFFDEGAGAIAKDGLFAADALLLGRVTYEHFAAAWPGMTDEEGFAERMNSMPKFVASTTLTDAERNATIIGNVRADVPRLKQQHDLLGAGERLFEDTAGTNALALTDTKTTDRGVTVLTYEVRR